MAINMFELLTFKLVVTDEGQICVESSIVDMHKFKAIMELTHTKMDTDNICESLDYTWTRLQELEKDLVKRY